MPDVPLLKNIQLVTRVELVPSLSRSPKPWLVWADLLFIILQLSILVFKEPTRLMPTPQLLSLLSPLLIDSEQWIVELVSDLKSKPEHIILVLDPVDLWPIALQFFHKLPFPELE